MIIAGHVQKKPRGLQDILLLPRAMCIIKSIFMKGDYPWNKNKIFQHLEAS